MDIQLKNFLKKISATLRRFHVVIFVVTVFGGLAIAVFVLSSILQASSDTSTTIGGVESLSPNFDQETIDKIRQLRTRQDSVSDLRLPAGRISPFAE